MRFNDYQNLKWMAPTFGPHLLPMDLALSSLYVPLVNSFAERQRTIDRLMKTTNRDIKERPSRNGHSSWNIAWVSF